VIGATMSDAISIAAWLRQAAARLRGAGVESPRHESELLLAHALGLESIALWRAPEQPLAPAQREAAEDLLARRALRWPLAYLRGVREFYSREFVVTPAVLIPRPETEVLVESALAFLRSLGRPEALGLEIGTGSGCIAATLLAEEPRLAMLATDVSTAAARVARTNLTAHAGAARFQVVIADLDAGLAGRDRFDVIVSNPPYVSLEERSELAPELWFEPRAALFAPTGDPTFFYRALALAAERRLTRRGRLLVEITPVREDAIATELERSGALSILERVPDLSGRTRVLCAAKKS
jgi:release factor glutamine methyltransferase